MYVKVRAVGVMLMVVLVYHNVLVKTIVLVIQNVRVKLTVMSSVLVMLMHVRAMENVLNARVIVTYVTVMANVPSVPVKEIVALAMENVLNALVIQIYVDVN